jgi:hypothetical protein
MIKGDNGKDLLATFVYIVYRDFEIVIRSWSGEITLQ